MSPSKCIITSLRDVAIYISFKAVSGYYDSNIILLRETA